MAVSGWCGQRGRPDHAGCRDPLCSCYCHLDPGAAGGRRVETVTLTTDIL